MPSRRPRLPLALLGTALATACLSQTARYYPARDEAALGAIASSFAEGGAGGVVLSLCEDVAASEGWAPECRYQHVVQGGGRARAHDEDVGGIGCGGCLFLVVAYVQGTVDGGPFAQPTAVRGTVTLQSGRDANPYGFPYGVDLRCEGAEPCALRGTLDSAGRLQLDVAAGTSSTTTRHLLAREGAAVCP